MGYDKFIIKILKSMDEKQLLELFHDIGDISTIERIADCAYHFVENYETEKDKRNNIRSRQLDADLKSGKYRSEEADWKEQDDLQRYRDIKSTQEN